MDKTAHRIALIACIALLGGCALLDAPPPTRDAAIVLYPTPGQANISPGKDLAQVTRSHPGTGAYVAEVALVPITRFFRILRPVECNRHVHLSLLGPRMIANHPEYLLRASKSGSITFRCEGHFHDLWADADPLLEGSDGVIYDARTYERSGYHRVGGRAGSPPRAVIDEGTGIFYRPSEEVDPRENSKHTPPLLSGPTFLAANSAGVYMLGFAVQFVDQPTDDDIADILGRGKSETRVHELQRQALLYWLERNDKGGYASALRAVLPLWQGEHGEARRVRLAMSRGDDRETAAALRTLATIGDEADLPLWWSILTPESEYSTAIRNGATVQFAANAIACVAGESAAARLADVAKTLPERAAAHRFSIIRALRTVGAEEAAMRVVNSGLPAHYGLAKSQQPFKCPVRAEYYERI